MKIGDVVRFVVDGAQVEATVYWLPSNGSVHVETICRTWRFKDGSAFAHDNPNLVSGVDVIEQVKPDIKPTFKEEHVDSLSDLYIVWSNSKSDLPFADWIIRKATDACLTKV